MFFEESYKLCFQSKWSWQLLRPCRASKNPWDFGSKTLQDQQSLWDLARQILAGVIQKRVRLQAGTLPCKRTCSASPEKTRTHMCHLFSIQPRCTHGRFSSRRCRSNTQSSDGLGRSFAAWSFAHFCTLSELSPAPSFSQHFDASSLS